VTNAVVVDANIVFSALLSDRNRFGEWLIQSSRDFVLGETVYVELFKHKEKILRASQLEEHEVLDLLYTFLSNIRIERERSIAPAAVREAYDLCHDIDVDDTIYVALTIHTDGRLWTGDKELRSGLEAKGFDRFFDP